jgi:hypothetical protein
MSPEDRLRELERIAAPDLWPEIRTRHPSARGPEDLWPRLATIGLALVLAAAGLGVAAVAFLGGPGPGPAATTSPTLTTSPTTSPVTPVTPDIEANHSDPWGAPTAVSLTCTRDGIEVLSAEVPAQPDGVHVIVDNPGGARIVHVHLKGPTPVSHPDRSLSVGVRPQGLARDIEAWPPGPVELSCHGHGIDERRETVHVTDPQGFWVSGALACEETVPYNRPAGLTLHADMEAAVRENVRGLLPTDEIVRTGYPQDPLPAVTMLVVRDGDPVAAITLIYAGPEEGGWIPNPGEICVGSGIMGA